MPKILKTFCVNCGNSFECREDRFPICKCGHTIPLFENDVRYAKIDCNDETYDTEEFYEIQSNLIIYDNGNEKKYTENDYLTLIEILPELYFYREDDVCILLLADLPYERNLIQDFTASELYLHPIYCQNSSVYNCLFDLGEINAARTMIHNKKLLNFNNKTQESYFRKTVSVYLEGELGDNIFTAIECCLNQFEIEYCSALIKSNLSLSDFKRLIRNTDFDKQTLCRYLNEAALVQIKGDDAIKMIEEYDFYKKEHEFLSVNFDEGNPIYHNHHLATISYNLYLKNGLLEYRKYSSRYTEDYDALQVDKFKIKLISGKELTDLSAGILPNGTTAPAIGVFENDNLVTLIANSNDRIYVNGRQDDIVKAAVNKFLDSTDGINI